MIDRIVIEMASIHNVIKRYGVDVWKAQHICPEIGDFIMKLDKVLPLFPKPYGLNIGWTNYWCNVHLDMSQCPKYGKTKDDQGRSIYFLDDVVICERWFGLHPHRNKFIVHLLSKECQWHRDCLTICTDDLPQLEERLNQFIIPKEEPSYKGIYWMGLVGILVGFYVIIVSEINYFLNTKVIW